MAARHVPMRTCVGCRQQRPKRELVRIVRTPAGSVELDPTGKRAGRGTYCCRDPRCWDVALRKGALARALKTELSATDRAALEGFARALAPADATAPTG